MAAQRRVLRRARFLDFYISYAVTFENRGPFTTLSDRSFKLVSLNTNWQRTVHYTGKIKTGLPVGAEWEFGPLQTDINANVLWYIELDGKDDNGWNDFIILHDSR